MFTSILVNVRRRDVIAETLFVDLEANFFPISGRDYELDLVLFVEPPESRIHQKYFFANNYVFIGKWKFFVITFWCSVKRNRLVKAIWGSKNYLRSSAGVDEKFNLQFSAVIQHEKYSINSNLVLHNHKNFDFYEFSIATNKYFSFVLCFFFQHKTG